MHTSKTRAIAQRFREDMERAEFERNNIPGAALDVFYRREFDERVAALPDQLTEVDASELNWGPKAPFRAWRSKSFVAQLFRDPNGYVRLSVNRSELHPEDVNQFRGDISWDELMQVKREIGMESSWMVECYPPDSEVVNVANMRHLWVLPTRPAFAWSKEAV